MIVPTWRLTRPLRQPDARRGASRDRETRVTQQPTPEQPDALLDRLVRRARAALVWEQLWRGLAPAFGVVALFLILSFLGLWQVAPRALRIGGLIAFALALLVSLAPLRRFRWPDRAEALARVDATSGLPHHPAAVLADAPADAADPLTRALWAAHRKRAAALRDRLRAGWPKPGLVSRDPAALRMAGALALAAAAIVAGPERYARVAAAFDWRGAAAAGASQRVDAWLDPPAYTGRAPILIELASPAFRAEPKLVAPVGSILVVRALPGAVEIKVERGLVVPPAEPADAATNPVPKPRPAAASETRLKLVGDARVAISGAPGAVTLDIVAIPDRPPTIALREPPQKNHRGSLTLLYRLDDDYGVASAEAVFTRPGPEGEAPARRVLGQPPRAPLALGASPGGLGEAQATTDLADHPWGGAEVDLTLVARDEGDNEGRGETLRLVMPQRAFSRPLARALVEQRRKLVLAPDDKARVVSALEALLIAPETFDTPVAVYLGLRSAARRLTRARADADLLDVADLFWEMALRIEDGDLSEAERDLRAAQQALREAIQRGAPPEEIAKLTQDLRAAMDKFLREMARQESRDQQQGEPRPNRSGQRKSRSVTPEQLAKMIDELEKRARSGDRADAQKALDELQNLLENLRTGQKRKPSEAARDMNQALDELDRMTREQQELRDETWSKGQGEERRARAERRRQQQERQRQRGQPADDDEEEEGEDEDQQARDRQRPGAQTSREALQKRQQALRDQLGKTRQKLRRHGQDGEKSLEEAEGAMDEAGKELGKSGKGEDRAADAQGRALQGLRKGAQALAEKMRQGEGEEGDGEGDEQADGGDPLGRDSANARRDNGRARYDPLGTPAAQRAQRVLEELRRRLADPARPREELDYLERLLRRY